MLVTGGKDALQFIQVFGSLAPMLTLMRLALGLWCRAGFRYFEATVKRDEVGRLGRLEYCCSALILCVLRERPGDMF